MASYLSLTNGVCVGLKLSRVSSYRIVFSARSPRSAKSITANSMHGLCTLKRLVCSINPEVLKLLDVVRCQRRLHVPNATPRAYRFKGQARIPLCELGTAVA